MSLAIGVSDVTHVLLADGWHAVADNSFWLDAYEFLDLPIPGTSPDLMYGNGTGFLFEDAEGGGLVMGPIASVLAVKTADS